jgi:predicted HTH domain antitoxin
LQEFAMPATIPDEVLQLAGWSEREALLEIACWLFDKEKLPLWPAAKLAGMSRGEFEQELGKRKIPIYRITPAELREEVAALERIRRKEGTRRQE